MEGAEEREAAGGAQAPSSADTRPEAAGVGPRPMPGRAGGRTAYLDPPRARFCQVHQACSSVRHRSAPLLTEL